MTTPCALGWHPDLPDPRDYTPWHEQVAPLLRDLPKPGTRPSRIDWRFCCVSGRECDGSAAICIDLLEQYEFRVRGRQLALSAPFVYRTSHRLAQAQRVPPLSLRAVWKAVARFGVPPLDLWPGNHGATEAEPDAFAYGGAHDYTKLCYVRLDRRGQSGPETLEVVQSFLSAGFLCVFGLPWCTSAGQSGEIGYPTIYDDVRGGQALMAVGYDNDQRVRSDRGCLAVRGCWGRNWGEGGYGWLPYSYVRERLATDFWTIFEPAWLESGDLQCPL